MKKKEITIIVRMKMAELGIKPKDIKEAFGCSFSAVSKALSGERKQLLNKIYTWLEKKNDK